ncbi:11432_t:CDS:2, partial [Racocetra persica]
MIFDFEEFVYIEEKTVALVVVIVQIFYIKKLIFEVDLVEMLKSIGVKVKKTKLRQELKARTKKLEETISYYSVKIDKLNTIIVELEKNKTVIAKLESENTEFRDRITKIEQRQMLSDNVSKLSIEIDTSLPEELIPEMVAKQSESLLIFSEKKRPQVLDLITQLYNSTSSKILTNSDSREVFSKKKICSEQDSKCKKRKGINKLKQELFTSELSIQENKISQKALYYLAQLCDKTFNTKDKANQANQEEILCYFKETISNSSDNLLLVSQITPIKANNVYDDVYFDEDLQEETNKNKSDSKNNSSVSEEEILDKLDNNKY